MTLSWTLNFLYSQFFISIPQPKFDLQGQTIIVTGSNTGLGLEAARHVARLGAQKLILAVRTTEKGDLAADDIARSTSMSRSSIESWQLDMGNPSSIKSFALRTKSLKRLDGVILNAGVMTSSRWTELSGNESHIAVNVIGTALLSTLLMPVLQKSATSTGLQGRLTVVGSEMMQLANRSLLNVDGSILKSLNDKSTLAQLPDRYPISKLLIYYNIHDFAQRHPLNIDSNVLITVSTPGACKSDLFRDGEGLALKLLLNTVSRTTEVGARTLVYGIDPNLPADIHGKFLMNNKVLNIEDVMNSTDSKIIYRKWNQELWQYLESL